MTKQLTEIDRDTVERWLKEIGHRPKDQEDDDANFHLIVEHPAGTGQTIQVIQPAGKPSALLIGTATTMAPKHVKAFDKLPDGEKREFQMGLRKTLNRIEVDYEIQGSNSLDECPDGFVARATRYADGLTLDSFARTVGAVYKTKIAAIQFVQEQLEGRNLDGLGRFDFERLGI